MKLCATLQLYILLSLSYSYDTNIAKNEHDVIFDVHLTSNAKTQSGKCVSFHKFAV